MEASGGLESSLSLSDWGLNPTGPVIEGIGGEKLETLSIAISSTEFSCSGKEGKE